MFKSKFNILLCVGISSLLCFVNLVKSDCFLPYPDDVEIAPVYSKFFGGHNHNFELPYTRSDIILQNGEMIHARCQTNFNLTLKRHRDLYYESYDPINLYNRTHIKLQCVGNTLYLKNYMLDGNVLMCAKLNWSIYENENADSWCNKAGPPQAALILATKSDFVHHILAEICFDLSEWSLQTITYNVTGAYENIEMLRDITKTQLQTVDSLGENLSILTSTFDLIEMDLQERLREMSEENTWLHLANYEISPIVQGKSYENYFKEYSSILNIIWWSNLRLGNWKRFMATLENYAYNNSFQIYTGTSGVVRKPISNGVNLSNYLTIKFGFKKKPVPAYIWTYLTSIDGRNRDFIIVGCNSPYAEFFSRQEVVFCPDICNEIPWLNGISDSFKFNTAGIMFCCSPESLQQTNPLNGFPMHILIKRSNTISKQENETFINHSTTSSSVEQNTLRNKEIYSYVTTVADNEIKSEELIDRSKKEEDSIEEVEVDNGEVEYSEAY